MCILRVKYSARYSNEIFRRLQRATKNKAEFTAQVSIPKNVENGPLLVKDIKKKDFISFVMPSEGGYKVRTVGYTLIRRTNNL